MIRRSNHDRILTGGGVGNISCFQYTPLDFRLNLLRKEFLDKSPILRYSNAQGFSVPARFEAASDSVKSIFHSHRE